MASLREQFEYLGVRALAGALRALPRRAARRAGIAIGDCARLIFGRLNSIADANLRLAHPSWSEDKRKQIAREVFRNLGLQLAEFCQMQDYSATAMQGIARCEGMENYLSAKARGKGVLVVTGHIGAWELSSFYHSLLGHPMGMVIRRLDNPRVDRFVNRIRCLHGNFVLHKDDFARGLLSAMRANQTVGILMDTNMTPPQGVFVPFFGVPACTASGLARVALKTDATVLCGYMVRGGDQKDGDQKDGDQKYVLHFEPAMPLIRTGNAEADILANTAQFTLAIENVVRRYPSQWLWMHRRWKTRPAGEPPLY